MKSIFEIENRLNIGKEFEKLLYTFQTQPDTVIYQNNTGFRQRGRFIEGINQTVFLEWKYRDTFLNVYEYLNHLGIDEYFLEEKAYNDKDKFLLYLEFMLNIWELIKHSKEIELTPIIDAALNNMLIILEKMNYTSKKIKDKVILIKRNADVDSVLEFVPEDISKELLEYNDFRIKTDLDAKKKILKEVDLYLEKNINIKGLDSGLKDSIGTIVNEMGVNHPINKEPYKLFSKEELLIWYDKCFLMMIHAIRIVEIDKIKKERKALVNS